MIFEMPTGGTRRISIIITPGCPLSIRSRHNEITIVDSKDTMYYNFANEDEALKTFKLMNLALQYTDEEIKTKFPEEFI